MNVYPIWKLTEHDKVSIRFLPDLNEDNIMTLFDEHAIHRIEVDGKPKMVLCPTMNQDNCNFCKAALRLMDKDRDSMDGRRLYRFRRYASNVLIIDDPLGISDGTESYKLMFNRNLFDELKKGIMHLSDLPTSYTHGTNFNITADLRGAYKHYTGKFLWRRSKLTEDQLEVAERSIIDLRELRPPELASDYDHIVTKALMWDILSND